MRYKAIIFDFDGTICNTGKGIMKSAAYALREYGYPVPENLNDLSYFIGPPLLITFQEQYNADPVQAENLVKKFRERYSEKGIYESELYNGIKALLHNLKADGFKLAIASSKPQQYIEKLLKHFNISKYFDTVTGVSFEADCEPKSDIIMRCLKKLDTEPDAVLMTGDKHYDIDGARMNHIDSMGVLWGFGTRFEFIEAGATFIAEKPSDIEAAALGFFEQTEETCGIFSGRIITVHEDTVMLTDGSHTKRELVDHNGGVAVVPLTDNGSVIMVRQFRSPYKEIMYEIPAGKLEKAEDPYLAGMRELEEECGVTADTVFELGKVYPTPGYCNEIIHIYGAVNLKASKQHLDDGEFLDVSEIPLEEAFNKCMNGEFKDAKTVIGIMKIREMKNNGSLS